MRLTTKMKKVFSVVLASAMVITGANVNTAKASAEDAATATETAITATVASDANGWGAADASEDATIDTTATEEKTYTVSKIYNTSTSISNYLAVRVEGLDKMSTTVQFSNVKLWLDGKAIEIAPNTGGDGDCRIEIVNTWGKTPISDAIKSANFNKVEIEFTVKFVPEGTVDTKSNTVITAAKNEDKTDVAPVAAVASDANGWTADSQVKETIDTTATEAKTYTVSNTYNSNVKVENYLAVRIEGLDKVAKTVEFSDVSVWLNGHAVKVDANRGGDGDCRIELVNTWGKTPLSEAFDGVLFNKVEVQFTIKFVPETEIAENAPITTVLAEDKADATPLPTGDDSTPSTEPVTPSTESVWTKKGLHAYISYQMDGTWDYRNIYEPSKTHDDKTSYDFIKAGDDVTYTADVKDALMDKDGEYTISISGIDLTGSDFFRWLVISTDIERAAYPDVKVTNATVKVDGNPVKGLEGIAVPYKNTSDDKYYTFAFASVYTDWIVSEGEPTYFGENNTLETVPANSIEITYTVSGLGNKIENNPVGAKVGKKFTSGNFVYQVTKQAKVRTNGAVKVVGLSKAGKKAKSITVAKTVKKTGVYNITAIDKNVFKGAAAKSVTLNKNIKKIPASAFVNCKNLSTLTLKAKLSSVAKGSFKGCKNTIKVKGTATKANVKKLAKSGYKNFK